MEERKTPLTLKNARSAVCEYISEADIPLLPLPLWRAKALDTRWDSSRSEMLPLLLASVSDSLMYWSVPSVSARQLWRSTILGVEGGKREMQAGNIQ